MTFHRPALRRLSFAAILVLAAPAPRLPAGELAPIGPGPFAVGSTNLEVSGRLDHPMVDYLIGNSFSRKPVYLADLLTHPDSALLTQVVIPAKPAVYGRSAGTRLPLVAYLLYPTATGNRRADYKFPYPNTDDNVFPHMQPAGEKPIFAAAGARYPLIIFSHGYNGHGLWDLGHLKYLAAHGYLVLSVFHGDGRATLDENLGIRPLALKAALDYLLNHPDFGPVIDRERIGLSGGSFGGYAVLAALGGTCPATADGVADPRIKAGFGLVPVMGSTLGHWPFALETWPFGRDFAGLKAVRTPFLAVYAEKDTNVPAASVMAGIAQISGPAATVELNGQTHNLTKEVWTDVYTWELLFFDTWLRGDAAARQQLYGGTSVRGGVDDHKTCQRAGRLPPK